MWILPAVAEDFTPASLTVQDMNESVKTEIKKATLSKTNLKSQYDIAFDRFVQSNVKAAYNDYKILVETMTPNDYAYMNVSEKMASVGFFDLAQKADKKISDKSYSYLFTDDLKRYYYPSKPLTKEDELYLAEIYSNIMYNAQSKEATDELVKDTALLSRSDYANYIAALGYFKSGDFKTALKFINTSINMNTENIIYKKLKAEILTSLTKYKDAIKVVDSIKKQPMNTTFFTNKVLSTEEYILYKSAKNEDIKNYHLGYYYYCENELPKAIRALQTNSIAKKKLNKNILALSSVVYFDMKEYEKALDNAQKAHRMDGNNVMALNVMGKLSLKNSDYKSALKYFKKAAQNDELTPESSLNLANVYEKLGETKKALEIYTKILKIHSNCAIAYYKVATLGDGDAFEYFKKSIAVDKDFTDGWFALAGKEIERRHLKNAQKYLAIANYIDEKDFRYYYYQGLIAKAQGLQSDADYYFQKSKNVNPKVLKNEELGI